MGRSWWCRHHHTIDLMIERPANDLEFLQRIDCGYRAGKTQEELATDEGCTTTALRWRVQALGFRFERPGGLRLVDTMLGRDLADWISSGELVPAREAVAS